MATANEILNYSGDKNLAFGSSSLPTGSDVVLDTSPVVNDWTRYAQNKLAVAKSLSDQLKARQLADQAEIADALKAGKYKIWAEDRNSFNKRDNEFRKLVVDVARKGNWNNINDPDFVRVMDMANELDKFAQYSTQQEKLWDTTNNTAKSNPKNWIDPETDLNAYKDIGDPFKRAEANLNLRPQAGWDATKGNNDLVKGLVTENADKITSDRLPGGNIIFTIPAELDKTEMVKRVNASLDNDRDGVDGWEYDFSIQPPQIQQQYASQPDPARAWAFDMKVNGLPLDLQSKTQIRGINYAPGTSTITTIPHDEEFSFNVTDQSGVAEKKNEINKELATLNNKSTKTDADNKRIIELKEQLKSTTGATTTVYGVGGGYRVGKTSENPRGINLFVKTAHLTGGTDGKQILTQNDIGSNAWTVDVVGRTNVYQLPNGKYLYTGQGVQKDLPTEDVVIVNSDAGGLFPGNPQTILIPYEDIATQLKNAKILFEPVGETQPQSRRQSQSGEQTYVANGTTYTIQDLKNLGYTDKDIADDVKSGELKIGSTKDKAVTFTTQQEAGIKAVMAKNPNATREQIIKALQDAGKLPK